MRLFGLRSTKPSVSFQELKKYKAIKAKMEGDNIDTKKGRPPIWF